MTAQQAVFLRKPLIRAPLATSLLNDFPNDRGGSPFSSVMGAEGWPAHLHCYSPGLAWLRKPGDGVRTHVSVPSDLFLITVYCDEQLQCGTIGEDRDLQVAVSALRTRPAQFQSSGGGALAVGLLTPLGLLQAFRVPMEELIDRRVPLAHFVGWPAQRALRDALLACDSPAERLQRLAGWLEQRLCEPPLLVGAPRRVAYAAMKFYDATDGVTVEHIAKELAVSRRQLERDFRRWLGVSPNTYARLVRFQRAIASISSGRELIHVAAMHGYADQSHMTRTFREMGSLTPGEVASLSQRPAAVRLQRAFAGRMLVAENAGSSHTSDRCEARRGAPDVAEWSVA